MKKSAAKWVLATAACAGVVWTCAFGVFGSTAPRTENRVPLPFLRIVMSAVLPALALAGVVVALFAVLLVSSFRAATRRRTHARSLVLPAVLAGCVGGWLSVPTILQFEPWVHPVVSSSILWALIGLLAGWLGSMRARAEREKPESPPSESLVALGRGIVCAACVGGAWAAVLLAKELAGVEYGPPDPPTEIGEATAMSAARGAGCGLAVGLFAGLRRRRIRRLAAFAVGGLCFGALGGAMSTVAVSSTPHSDPILVSSLAWAAVGFLAGVFAPSPPALPRGIEAHSDTARESRPRL